MPTNAKKIRIGGVSHDIEDTQARTDISELKSSFGGYQSGNLPITIIKNSYVNTNGQISPYNGWDRTDYIPVNQYYSIFVKSSVASGYNVFYDENKNKISDFLVTVNGATRFIPTNAAYVIFSNTAQGMRDLIARYNKAEMVPRKADNITTLSTLTNMGVYGISRSVFANITDKPSDSDDAVATLINYLGAYADGRFLIQRLNQTSGKIWERIINTDSQTVSYDWKRIDVNSQNVLAGKKLVTAGDSYTAANWAWSQDYIQYDGKNFGYYIAKRNQMTFVNAGISGSTMAIPTNGEGHNPFVVDRYQNIPADADYLTIWFGINDAAYCTLGTIDDEVDNTFYGAWNKVLRYYLTNRPWLKILIIVTVMANPDVRQATRDIAKKWGYPYLDWEKDVSIPAFFMREGMSDEAKNLRRAAFGYNGPNEGHPNPQFYEYESTIIEAKLRSI